MYDISTLYPPCIIVLTDPFTSFFRVRHAICHVCHAQGWIQLQFHAHDGRTATHGHCLQGALRGWQGMSGNDSADGSNWMV